MAHHENEETVDGVETNPAALSFVGGTVGTILGARRGPVGAVVGGVVGGTAGYLAGAAVDPETDPATVEEPVSIDVGEPESAATDEQTADEDGE